MFKPDQSIQHTINAIIAVLVVFCLAGFFSGHISVDEEGTRRIHALVWDLETILYSVGLIAMTAASFFTTRYYQDSNMRWGARILICFAPLAIFVILAMRLVEVGGSMHGS